MLDCYNDIILIIRSAISGRPASISENPDIEKIADIAGQHQISGLVYYGAVQCGVPQNDPGMKKLFALLCIDIVNHERQLRDINRVTEAFLQSKADYMPLKGINLKKLYPRPEMRNMCDADILIKPEQHKIIASALKGIGFSALKESAHEYIFAGEFLNLELHKCLIPPYDKDLYDFFGDGWQFAEKGNNQFEYKMSEENEFLFLFAHFAKHYRSGGVGIKQLTDLKVFLNAYPDLNTEYIISMLKKMGLFKFYVNIMHLLAVWFESEKSDKKTDFLTSVIFESGPFGTYETRFVADTAVSANNKRNNALKLHFLRLIFPPLESMRLQYRILNNAPFLLPAVWVARWFKVIIFKNYKVNKRLREYNIISGTSIEDYRSTLNYVGLTCNFEEKNAADECD